MIEVKNLNFTYNKTTSPTLKGLDFKVNDGEIFGFLGPSGAGKSTTQKILIGLLRDFEGTIKVFERDLNDWKSDYYERIGVSFEVPNLFMKLSALENLTYFGALYSVKTRNPQEVLEWVGLPTDDATLVSQFSKGMKNRLNVARSLLNDAELLFMDEPTAGLDPVNARRIKDLIRAQKDAGKTVFLTTHDMTVADELCDRVAFIVNGEIKLIDSPRNLKLGYGEHKVRVEYKMNGHTESQDFQMDQLGRNNGFIHLLQESDVQTIHTQEATLEDIFIKVTGRSLI